MKAEKYFTSFDDSSSDESDESIESYDVIKKLANVRNVSNVPDERHALSFIAYVIGVTPKELKSGIG